MVIREKGKRVDFRGIRMYSFWDLIDGTWEWREIIKDYS